MASNNKGMSDVWEKRRKLIEKLLDVDVEKCGKNNSKMSKKVKKEIKETNSIKVEENTLEKNIPDQPQKYLIINNLLKIKEKVNSLIKVQQNKMNKLSENQTAKTKKKTRSKEIVNQTAKTKKKNRSKKRVKRKKKKSIPPPLPLPNELSEPTVAKKCLIQSMPVPNVLCKQTKKCSIPHTPEPNELSRTTDTKKFSMSPNDLSKCTKMTSIPPNGLSKCMPTQNTFPSVPNKLSKSTKKCPVSPLPIHSHLDIKESVKSNKFDDLKYHMLKEKLINNTLFESKLDSLIMDSLVNSSCSPEFQMTNQKKKKIKIDLERRSHLMKTLGKWKSGSYQDDECLVAKEVYCLKKMRTK